tara:strand:+ start:188 stop:556 length:369 start_codon:yes stop_codon:yes gene_type:complete
MKLHHTKYKENYKQYILSTIETDNNNQPITTEREKINYIFNRFHSEYDWNIKRIGKQKALAEWLSGLALDIPFYYQDIVELAVDMGSIEPNPTDKVIERVEQGYWDFMANIILSFNPNETIL